MREQVAVETLWARDDCAIRAEGLVKMFGDLRAVNGIDLEVKRGEIFAILGPNGAGKTTLMRMLATLLTPDGGSVNVMGHDLLAEPQAVRASIAMTGQFASCCKRSGGTGTGLPRRRTSGFDRSWRRCP